ncbi:putative ABC transporter C family member 15 isoform X1 [Chenopodium quinoa]|uniref:putative ABC transporter C family member 15 isoform X1 n=1 Tax=Chenopodium quinoa TaxID=63459 RepID=UPI000B786199|nr:putative ABC transporter C family member 15 isoform X1 [Chenopodium quinoa]
MPYSFLVANIKLLKPTAWEQLKSPCLWEEISTFLLLGFYGILLLYFIRKMAYAVHMFTTKATEKDAEMYPDNARLSLCSKVSIVSSTLLLSVHLTSLCLLVKGNKISCDHYVPALAAEILQVISWIITIIVLCRTLTKNYLIFPGILRFWWVCSFLITACHVAVAFNFVMDNHGQLRIQEYADFLGFFASVSLLVISIQGKMKIAHDSARSNLTEPLLNGETGKKFKGKVESLYSKATLLDLVTFSWLNPLFVIGKKKPLEQDEIPEVDVKDSAAFLSQCFNENLKQAKEEEGITNSTSVYKAIFQLAWKKAAVNALFAVISAFASYVGPYLINDFVVFLSEKKHSSLKTGYLLALGFLGAKVVETIAQRQWIFGARQLGLRLRAAMISQIYQKGLMLSCQARQSHTSGEIMNYMSVDVQRISDFVWYVNTLWMLPVQISLAIYVLHTSLGLGSLAGLAATLVVMSCNIPLTRTQKKYQSKIMDAKDARMKATSEILRNMKSIKLQAWDNQFRHKLESLRNIESSWIWKSLRLGAVGAFIFWGSPTFISIITFGACLLMGIPLTAGSVLSALATFRMLQDPIFSLPDLLNVVAQAKVSADRVSSYLQGEEIQQDAVKFVSKDKTPYAIDIEGGKLSWDPNSETPTLDNINLQVTRGMKVAICGTVGSGKSSLLSGLIGEIPKISGTVKISGSKAYVPQTPWILTGNIKENILFGSPYDAAKYDRTVKACALLKDFELFPQGDLTEIGERGINMSGGQKQRIQIARAVYQDADIYLLDDPFSAVDAHTGTQLFQECLMEVLGDKTIFYVTHQVEFLPAADLILVMQDGKISEAGTFKELLKQNIGFEVLVGAHSQALDSVLKVEGASGRTSKISLPQNVQSSAEQIQTRDEEEEKLSPEMKEKEGRLIQDEEREKGSIGKEVYWAYLTIVKRGILVPVIVLAQSSFQVLQIASNYWMAWACPTSGDAAPVAEMDYVLLVYAILSIISSICVLVRASVLAYAGLSTAQKLFENMLHSVLRAPMSFFDSTPTGRILNRASSDQSVLDLEMAQRLGWAAFSMIQLLGTIAVMSQVAWEVFLIFIPVTAICIWYKQYYIPTARELARLSEIQKAPILHHFGESLSGAATIRAFDQKDRFINANLVLVDGFSRPWFHNVSAMEWLSFRLNQLSNFVFAFSLVLLVSLPDGIINPSIAGLAVTYGINLNVLQASVIWNICNAENKMISVERVLQYTELNSEAPMIIDDCRPPNNWPTTGTITFQNLQIRYAEHLPSVLKKITCTLPGMKKIGVVGRTGSGKSTLIQALFRIVEPKEGSIIIDDVDICKIGLHDLRSRLSIIPQDPTMFDGTVRINLDPLQQHSDNDIWEALDKCQLGDLVRAKEGRLESTVVENGENWSVGQRQLFCLGRALLKHSSVLVLDEATASVDSATDGVIQKIINQEFQERTIVTIAHRIHTVVDSDLVLVLSDGRIAEYDSPSKLLEREDSFFSRLVREYSTRSQTFNNTAKLEG